MNKYKDFSTLIMTRENMVEYIQLQMFKNISQRFSPLFSVGSTFNSGIIAGLGDAGKLADEDYFQTTRINTHTVRVQPGYAIGSNGEIITMLTYADVIIPAVEGSYFIYLEYDEGKSLTGYEKAFPGGIMTPDTIYTLINDSGQITVGTVDTARVSSKIAIAKIMVNSGGEIPANSSTVTSDEILISDVDGTISLAGALSTYDSDVPYLLIDKEYINVSESGGVFTIVSRESLQTILDHHHFESVASPVVWSAILDYRHYNIAQLNLSTKIDEQIKKGIVDITTLGERYLLYHTSRLEPEQIARLNTLTTNLVINMDDDEGDKLIKAEKIPSMPNEVNDESVSYTIIPDEYDIADSIYSDVKLRELSLAIRSRYQGKKDVLQDVLEKMNELSLWAEKVGNGTFDDDSIWTKGTGWTIAANVASKVTGVASDLEQNASASASTQYRITFTVSSYSAGTLTPEIGGVEGTAVSANGTYQQDITTTGTGNLKLKTSDNLACDVDNVSVSIVNELTTKIDDAEVAGALSESEADTLLGYKSGEESTFTNAINVHKATFQSLVDTENDTIDGLEDTILDESEKLNEGTPFVTGKLDISWVRPTLVDSEEIVGYRVKAYATIKTFTYTTTTLKAAGATDPQKFEFAISDSSILRKYEEKHTDFMRKTVEVDLEAPLGKKYAWNDIVNIENIQYPVSAEMRFVIYIAAITEYGVVGNWSDPCVIDIPNIDVDGEAFSDWVDDRATIRRMRGKIEQARILRKYDNQIAEIQASIADKVDTATFYEQLNAAAES